MNRLADHLPERLLGNWWREAWSEWFPLTRASRFIPGQPTPKGDNLWYWRASNGFCQFRSVSFFYLHFCLWKILIKLEIFTYIIFLSEHSTSTEFISAYPSWNDFHESRSFNYRICVIHHWWIQVALAMKWFDLILPGF